MADVWPEGTGSGAGGPGAARPTVLVLDDEPDVLVLVRLVLERAGCRVLTSGDGREAMSSLRAETVDVALVDLLMPGMSGRQFLEEVQRLEPARRPRVLILSALSPEAVAREVGAAGAYQLLSKPFDFEDLLAAVTGPSAGAGPR